MAEEEVRRRALAALRALAVGDAMGAAAEGYAPDEIIEVYDGQIAELVDPVNLYPESAPDRARGRIGPVTEGAIEAARALAAGATPPAGLALGWSVALGIASAAADLEAIVEGSRRFDAWAAPGAAVAAAVSAGVGGYMARDALALAVRAVQVAGAQNLARTIMTAAGAAQASGGRNVGAAAAAVVRPGPDAAGAVAFAFGVAFGAQSVRRALPQAVNQGGEASLSAGLAGALCAAVAPGSAVEAWSEEVEAANGLDLRSLAEQLLAVRRRDGAAAP